MRLPKSPLTTANISFTTLKILLPNVQIPKNHEIHNELIERFQLTLKSPSILIRPKCLDATYGGLRSLSRQLVVTSRVKILILRKKEAR